MSRSGSQLDRLIAATRRRLFIADAVRLSGRCLMSSASLALGLTLFDRFVVPGLPWWALAAVALSGLPVAISIAWHRRSASLSAAVRLDDGLRLKDRLGSAIALSLDDSADHESGMSQLVHEDAERIAAGIDPRSAARIDWPMSWGAALLVALFCVPLLWFVKPRNVFARPESTADQVAALDARQEAAESLRQRAEQLRSHDPLDEQAQEPGNAQARQQALDTLDRLARQFDSPPGGSPNGSSKAASSNDAQLSSAAQQAVELADRLDQQSQIQREVQKRTIDGLSNIEPPSTPDSEGDFAQSLRQGDLASAQQWLQDLEDRLKNAAPAEREALADSLRETAEQIRQAADKSNQPGASSNDSSESQSKLEDLGLTPEQIKQWTEQPPSIDDIRRELQNQGQDPIDAQQLAEQAQRDLAQRAAEEKAKRQLEETAKRVSDLADSVEPPPPTAEQQDQPKSERNEQPGATTPGAETSPSTSDNSGEARDTPQEQKSPASDQSAGEDGQPKRTPEQTHSGDKPGTKPGEQPAQNGDQGEPGSADKPQEGADPTAKPTETTKPGEGSKPTETARPDATTKPGESARPGEATDPGEDSQPKESPVKAPGESPLTNPVPKESNEPGANPVPREGAEPPRTGTPEPGETGKPISGQPATGEPDPDKGAKPEPGVNPKTDAPDAPGEQGLPEPGATSSPGESPDGQAPDTRVTPSNEPGTSPSASDSNAPGSVSDRVKRLRDTLDEIDRSGKSADQGQEISQEMRDAAKDLLDRMSPEEREELQRWAEAKARENSGGEGSGRDGSPKSLLDRTLPTQAVRNPKLFEYDTQDVDLTPKGDAPNDRVIAEMYGPDQKRPEGAVDRQPMNVTQMREAAQAIERALNEEAIPPRYRTLIRNWARRLPKVATPSPAPTDSPNP